MKERYFRRMLKARQEAVDSLVCVGLDPLLEKLPDCIKRSGANETRSAGAWMRDIVRATAPFACCFKPQRAHWEALPYGGEVELRNLIAFIKQNFPDIPVMLDCKRGDIDRTQQQYRCAHFERDGADAMNYSPYMGPECMANLVDKAYPGRGIVCVCYTSNLGGRRYEDMRLTDHGNCPLWEVVATDALRQATDLGVVNDAGLVMAAAYVLKAAKTFSNFQLDQGCEEGKVYSYHLSRCRQIVGDKLWFLIPGIGTQGGCLEETIRTAYMGPGSIAINSSSAIIFASAGEDFEKAAATEAQAMRDQGREVVSKILAA